MNYNNIINDINDAKKLVPCIWPLKSFIANNPLWDMIDQSLFDTAKEMSKYIDIDISLSITDYQAYYLNRKFNQADIYKAAAQITSWSSHEIDLFTKLIFDEVNVKKLAHHEDELSHQRHYQTLLIDQLTNHFDASLTHDMLNDLYEFYARYFSKKQNYTLLKAWCMENNIKPCFASEYIVQRCQDLQLNDIERSEYFKHILCRTMGYAGFIKWLEHRPDNPLFKSQANTIDMIAIWLLKERAIAANYPDFKFIPQATSDVHPKYQSLPIDIDLGVDKEHAPSLSLIKLILHLAWENAYIEAMENTLNRKGSKLQNDKPEAQFLFCIDTRSEGLRRQIERSGHYHTYGFAGFYGLPLQSQSSAASERLLCPAICEPAFSIETYKLHSPLSNTYQTITSAIKSSKLNGAAALDLYDVVGFWYAPITSINNMMPTAVKKMMQYIRKSTEHIRLPSNDKVDIQFIANQITGVLKTIGLTKNWAKYIFVCGHEAETTNNPYQASLECGACGGNSGYFNAKVFCEYANRRDIRKALSLNGIHIPESTRFMSACHNTTKDELIFHTDKHVTQCDDFKKIKDTVTKSTKRLREEKANDTIFSLYQDNHSAWSELVPESGLLNNSMMIIGPRTISQDVNLQRRSFLHSYDHENDHDGKILEGIMTAPMIVAHWINMQYFFSSTSPSTYGSGNKALHNVLGDIGVLEGNGGDLKIGLPLQSISYRSILLHEPRRLAVFIYAPKQRVDQIIANNATIQKLINGNWIHLRVIEPKE